MGIEGRAWANGRAARSKSEEKILERPVSEENFGNLKIFSSVAVDMNQQDRSILPIASLPLATSGDAVTLIPCRRGTFTTAPKMPDIRLHVLYLKAHNRSGSCC